MTDVPPEEPEEYEPDEATPEESEVADPEEYEPDEPQAAVSEETGTVYDRTGEPEVTPEDTQPVQDES